MRVGRRVGKESGEEGSRRGPEIDIFSLFTIQRERLGIAAPVKLLPDLTVFREVPLERPGVIPCRCLESIEVVLQVSQYSNHSLM